MRGHAFWVGLDLIAKNRRGIIKAANRLVGLREYNLRLDEVRSLPKQVKHSGHNLLGAASAEVDLTKEQDGLDIVRIFRQGLAQDQRCLRRVLILQIGTRQLVFDRQDLRIACVEALQPFESL